MSKRDDSKPRDVDHGDVQMLHASLLAAERRAAMLTEVIEALSLSPDATILAQRAVELVTRASGADGAFVYLWDAERSLLVMRAATEGRQQRFVNKMSLRLGEGITGWSALMRRTALVADNLLEDPRFVHIPSAMEADFKSALFGGLTHYATGPAPIYFGSGYIPQGTWWKLGFILSLVNLAVFIGFGSFWWKLVGLW